MQYAWDNGISCVLTDKMNEYTPSSAKPENKIILINLNWYNQSEIVFQMAHEIGHVVNFMMKESCTILVLATSQATNEMPILKH